METFRDKTPGVRGIDTGIVHWKDRHRLQPRRRD